VSSGVAEDGEDEFEIKQRVQRQQLTAESLLDSDDDRDPSFITKSAPMIMTSLAA